ncbi:MAG: glycogen synthase [Alphaproteobacteria bacterium]|nr:glycogen synthase [Alphaproteobacteria bacterium]
MKTLLITNEYPPYIYGGAGVHVEYLSKELAKLMQVEVRSFHDQTVEEGNLVVHGTTPDASLFTDCPKELASPLKAFYEGLVFAGKGMDADVAHCHTWYAHFAGLMAKMLYGIPLVVTVHSLEPLRPWKREQLGRGYDVSSWVEKTALEMADAVIAVSTSTREDVLRLFPKIDPDKVSIIYNGIDVNQYKEVEDTAVLQKFGIRTDKPYVLFVGRMTRQKGLLYLLKAASKLDPEAQLVLCAGDADTPEMKAELEGMVASLKQVRSGVVWIPEMVSREEAIALYSQATVFCCPSIYEPFGIINLEAMACSTPVVASAVGGITEVVVDGETGFLVDADLSDKPPHDPKDAEAFATRLADKINLLIRDPALAKKMGQAGRLRVEKQFSWQSIARQTKDLYAKLIEANKK